MWKAEIDYGKQIEMPETKDGGGDLYVSMNVWECIRKQIHPFSILMFSFPVHTQKHIYYHYLVSHIKSQLTPLDAIKETRSFWLTQEVAFKQAFSPPLYKYLLPIWKTRLEFMFLSLSSPIKRAMDQTAASFPIVADSSRSFWPPAQ